MTQQCRPAQEIVFLDLHTSGWAQSDSPLAQENAFVALWAGVTKPTSNSTPVVGPAYIVGPFQPEIHFSRFCFLSLFFCFLFLFAYFFLAFFFRSAFSLPLPPHLLLYTTLYLNFAVPLPPPPLKGQSLLRSDAWSSNPSISSSLPIIIITRCPNSSFKIIVRVVFTVFQ